LTHDNAATVRPVEASHESQAVQPSKSGPQVHDRRAKDVNRGEASHLVEVEIDDPFEASSRIAGGAHQIHATRQIAAARGLTSREWQRYFANRFGGCLNGLVIVYGFSSGVTTSMKHIERLLGRVA
jgi:hypothetical protein